MSGKQTDKASFALAAIMVLIPGALILGLNALVWAYLLLERFVWGCVG